MYSFSSRENVIRYTSATTSSHPEKSIKISEMSFKKCAKIAARCGVGAAVAVGVVNLALPILGFGSAGIVAGSPAAAIQSAIGNVAAESTFAALQSAGVVGLATTTKVAVAVGGAAAAVAAAT